MVGFEHMANMEAGALLSRSLTYLQKDDSPYAVASVRRELVMEEQSKGTFRVELSQYILNGWSKSVSCRLSGPSPKTQQVRRNYIRRQIRMKPGIRGKNVVRTAHSKYTKRRIPIS